MPTTQLTPAQLFAHVQGIAEDNHVELLPINVIMSRLEMVSMAMSLWQDNQTRVVEFLSWFPQWIDIAEVIGEARMVDDEGTTRRGVFVWPEVVAEPSRCSERQYAVVLHELGHLLHPKGWHVQSHFVAEHAAWTWAMANAKVWTVDCHVVCTFSLINRYFTMQLTRPEVACLKSAIVRSARKVGYGGYGG